MSPGQQRRPGAAVRQVTSYSNVGPTMLFAALGRSLG
jgi:hypothetical protein